MQNFEFSPLASEPGRQSTRTSLVLSTLRQAIVQLRLHPGHLLSEAEIARQLGVSRQPVREAFIKLAEAGLVEIWPQRGTMVVWISRRDVENARFLREAIETAVVSRAASLATSGDISGLRDLVAQQNAAGTGGDHPGFLALDEDFHQTLAGIADCEHAWRVVEGLKAQMDRVRYLSISDATPVATIVRQHHAIIDALEQGAVDAAATAMRTHLTEIVTSLPKLAEKHPDLFRD